MRFPALHRSRDILSSRIILGGIITAGLLLRCWGLPFGLPHLYHADEPIVVNHALAYGTGDLNPHFFRIPPLLSYLLFLVYGILYAAGSAFDFFQGKGDFERLFYADPTLFYLTGRFLFGVIPGTLSILALYALVRRFFNEPTAFFSAALFSVSFLHVRDSHYIYPDITLILLIIVVMGRILKLTSDSSLRNHLAAGALIGVATAMKYNGLFLVVPYVAAVFMESQGRLSRKKIIGMTSAGVSCCLIFLLLNPFSVLDLRFFLQEIAGEGSARKGGAGLFHHWIYSLTGALGVIHLLFSLLGMTLLTQFRAGQPRAARRILILFAAGYYLVLVFWGQLYDRYVLPLLPFFAFFAADAFLHISSRCSGSRRRWAAAFLFLAAASFPVAKSILVARLFQSVDVRTEAKAWIESHVPPGTRIALDTKFYMPPLLFSRSALEDKRQSGVTGEGGDFMSAAQGRRLQFLFDMQRKEPKGYNLYFFHPEPFPEGRFLLWGPFVKPDYESLAKKEIRFILLVSPEFSQARDLYPELEKQAVLLKRFTPYKDPERRKPYDSIALTGLPFLWSELFQRCRNGQVLELYELKSRERVS